MTVVDRPRLPSDNQFAQDLFEEARRRRWRRYRRWTSLIVGLSGVGAFILLTVARTGTQGGAHRVGQGTQTTRLPLAPIPPEMVVWRSNFRIDVISSTTGKLIRTLATDVALFRGTPQPTASPSGTVYFDDAGIAPNERILSVALSGGPISFVADGQDPAVSPNGRFLAYLTYVQVSPWPEAIVVRDLLTGTTKRWQYSANGPDISRLTWAPDSQTLAFSGYSRSPDKQSLTLGAWQLNVASPSGSLDVVQRLPLPTGMEWVGFMSQGQGIVVSQHRETSRRSSTFTLSVLNTSTGRTIARLPSVHGQLGVDNVFDGAEGTVQLDLSAQHLAIVGTGSGNGTLYRWTIGDQPHHVSSRPIAVATGVLGAAWAP